MTRTALAAAVLVLVVTAPRAPAAAADPLPRLGVMADVGVPDGGTAALVVRPLAQVRLSAGLSHNLIGPGVRGAITLVPLPTWFTPTLSVSYGHYFERDATSAARSVSGDPMLSSPALERVGYDYADAHLGLELGRRRVTFYLHGGLTRVTGHVRNLDQTTGGADGSGDVSVSFTRDPSVTLTKIGRASCRERVSSPV